MSNTKKSIVSTGNLTVEHIFKKTKSLCISPNVFSLKLKPIEILFMSIVYHYNSMPLGCCLSNTQLASLLSSDEKTIRRLKEKLVEKNYINLKRPTSGIKTEQITINELYIDKFKINWEKKSEDKESGQNAHSEKKVSGQNVQVSGQNVQSKSNSRDKMSNNNGFNINNNYNNEEKTHQEREESKPRETISIPQEKMMILKLIKSVTVNEKGEECTKYLEDFIVGHVAFELEELIPIVKFMKESKLKLQETEVWKKEYLHNKLFRAREQMKIKESLKEGFSVFSPRHV